MGMALSVIGSGLGFAVAYGHTKIKECATKEVDAYFNYKACALETKLISIEASQHQTSDDVQDIKNDLKDQKKLIKDLIIAISTRG